MTFKRVRTQVVRAFRTSHASVCDAHAHDRHYIVSTFHQRLTRHAPYPRARRSLLIFTGVNRCSRRAWATVRSRMPRRRECFTAGSRPQWRWRLCRQSEARVGRPRRPSVSPRAQLFSSGVWMRWWLGPGFWLACAQPEVFCRCTFGCRCTHAGALSLVQLATCCRCHEGRESRVCMCRRSRDARYSWVGACRTPVYFRATVCFWVF